MTSLKEGEKAPNFSVPNQDDKLLTLDSYKGKKLILYFYPKDSTPGCPMGYCEYAKCQGKRYKHSYC